MPTRSRSSPSTAARACEFPRCLRAFRLGPQFLPDDRAAALSRRCGETGARRRLAASPAAIPQPSAKGSLRHRTEESAEQLRLLYVAVTRARSQVVLWWAPATTAECAPLSRLLFGIECRQPTSRARRVAVPFGQRSRAAARSALARQAAGMVAIEPACDAAGARWAGAAAPTADLRAARFERELDLAWRRTSYSALTAAAHDAGGASGVDPSRRGGERAGARRRSTTSPRPASRCGWRPLLPMTAAAAVTSPMARLPGGTAFGSLVHAVLETVDTTRAPLTDEISERVAEQLSRWGAGGECGDRRGRPYGGAVGGLRDAAGSCCRRAAAA